MAERKIIYRAGVNTLTPSQTQYPGVQGEHCAAEIVFQLDKELISTDYQYRVEFVDGMNTFHTTELLVLSDAGLLTVPLIRAWTQAGGAGEVRLAVSKLKPSLDEEMLLYTLTGRLYFESRDSCEAQEREVAQGLSALIAGVKQAQTDSCQATGQAREAANEAKQAASTAKQAGNLAEEASKNAAKAEAMLLGKANSGGFDGHGFSVLGIYGSLAELQQVHFRGSPGDAYAIGTAAANNLYVWNTSASAWQNIGNVLGGWTMNDLCIDAGDLDSGAGGWMMDSLCMDAGDWDGPGGSVSTLSEHEVDSEAHSNMIIDGNKN